MKQSRFVRQSTADTITVNGYSERGIINAFVFSCMQNVQIAKEWIAFLLENQVSAENINNISMYVEQSLSDFGDPDLMIKFKNSSNGNESLIFVEAKVKTWSKTKWKNCQKEFDKFEKKQSSNLIQQLGLKIELVNHLGDAQSEKGYLIMDEKIRCDKNIENKKRKTGNSPIIKEILNIFSSIKDFYYVAIVPNYSGKEKINSDIISQIQFITWEKLKDFAECKKLTLVQETFKYNNPNNDDKGQIY